MAGEKGGDASSIRSFCCEIPATLLRCFTLFMVLIFCLFHRVFGLTLLTLHIVRWQMII